jgi:Zn-dependent protease
VLGENWWVIQAWEESPVILGAWVFWVIVSITLHELGHGWAAIRCGDRTPILTGHMTWNPVVHMGPHSLIAFAIFGFAWGAMPVDPTRFRRRYDDLLVSGAGPMMNLSLAVVCAVGAAALALWDASGTTLEDFRRNAWVFLFMGATLNVALLVLNLLPIPPLDGSRMLASASPAFDRLMRHERAPIAGLVLFALVFFLGAGLLFEIGATGAAWGVDAAAWLLAGGGGR